MKRRIIFKKGKIVITRSPEFVLSLSGKVFKWLNPLSKKIKVVGSIRRKEKKPVDIDLVLIPKDKEKIKEFLNKKGKEIRGGEHLMSYKIQGVSVELYFATLKDWGSMVLSYTGPKGSSIGMRKIAKSKGWLLNQYGLFKNKKKIAGKTEREIYEKLGKVYKSPCLR